MKPNNWVSSSQATELLSKQLVTWPLAEKNYKALEAVQVKSFDMGGFSIRAQFNPARIVSTGAKVDARSLKERKCFLCPENLPVEQERLPFGFRHLVLCNPYPIFPQHFTIPTRKHTPQLILPQWNDFLELTRRLAPFTVFYNGPRSGASAPDHAHFQAVTRGIMPLDEEVTQFIRHPYASVYDTRIFPLTGNLRPGLVIQAATAEAAKTADSLWGTNGDLYTANGISKATVETYLLNAQKAKVLLKMTYGPDGTSPVTDAEYTDYINNDCYYIEAVQFPLVNYSTYSMADDGQKAAIMATA